MGSETHAKDYEMQEVAVEETSSESPVVISTRRYASKRWSPPPRLGQTTEAMRQVVAGDVLRHLERNLSQEILRQLLSLSIQKAKEGGKW